MSTLVAQQILFYQHKFLFYGFFLLDRLNFWCQIRCKWSTIWIFAIWDHYYLSGSILKNVLDKKEFIDLQVKLLVLQLNPALTDFKGPTSFICHRQIYVIAKCNIGNKRKLVEGIINLHLLHGEFCCWRVC